MAIFLIDLPPSDMERRLGDALTVYVDAMRYPRGTETLRAPMWLEPTMGCDPPDSPGVAATGAGPT